MTRLVPLLLTALLAAGPGFAGSVSVDLPNLTYPPTDTVTPSTSGPATAPPKAVRD